MADNKFHPVKATTPTAQAPPAAAPPARPTVDPLKLFPGELFALAQAAKPIEGPVVNGSTVQFIIASNDAMLMFMRPKPLISPEGQISPVALTETTAIIHLSMATVKDLSLLLSDQLSKYEKTN